MRLVLLSDTHNKHGQISVPDGDILIHAGDFTMGGSQSEVYYALSWFKSLPHKHKVCVAGNHDFLFERTPELARSMTTDIIYLEDCYTVTAGLRIYGSPVQPSFGGWAFNVDRGAPIKRYWDRIPEGLDVLITHGPPMGILDKSSPKYGSQHVGCEELTTAVERVKPRIHVFGHIHDGYGRSKKDETTYYNASVMNDDYEVVNKPWVVDI